MNSLTLATALCAISLTASSPAWALYKCVANGKTLYQETPCAASEAESQIREPAKPAVEDGTDAQLRIAIERAVLNRVPVRGMNEKQLERALGQPNRVNIDQYASGVKQQRIYERPEGTFYVYVESGLVSAVQFTQAIQSAPAPARQARYCPDALTIKNAETSANSITLTPAQRADRAEEIRRMKACQA